jgi:hypothetical protein
MRHRKIPAKKNRGPTHFVELCPVCKDGILLKKVNVKTQEIIKICQACHYISSPLKYPSSYETAKEIYNSLKQTK